LKTRGSHVILDHHAAETIKAAKSLGLKVKTKSDPRWHVFFEVSAGERKLKTHASTSWELPASFPTMNPPNGIMEASQDSGLRYCDCKVLHIILHSSAFHTTTGGLAFGLDVTNMSIPLFCPIANDTSTQSIPY